MRTLFGYAAAHGYRRIELEVLATNTAAIRLYEREGFAHEGRRRGAVMVAEQAVDLLMRGEFSAFESVLGLILPVGLTRATFPQRISRSSNGTFLAI